MLSYVRLPLYRTGLNVVATNGIMLFPQFYNVSTNCLEASVEVVRSNRDTSAKSWQTKGVKGEGRGGGGAASHGPVVEHVAFSSDGKVIILVSIGMIFHGTIYSYGGNVSINIDDKSEIFRHMIRSIKSVDVLDQCM